MISSTPERQAAPLLVALDWIQRHCVIPDGFRRGAPFRLYDFQLRYLAAHYLVRGDVEWDADEPILGPAFVYRRSMVTAPQKALALDTPVPTPSGWSTMGELRVGDLVFDENGDPCHVTSKSQVWNVETYRVSFSDGASIVACGDHEWAVDRRTSSSAYVPERIRTSDLVGNLIDAGGARRFRVSVAKPLNLPEVDLPLDPYVLGAWLGDGETDGGRLTGLDREIFHRIESMGFPLRQGAIIKRVGFLGLKKRLRVAGVLGQKHIPEVYLRASEKQRWALLQGLMDTDGWAQKDKGTCEFTTVLPRLRDGFRELLYSLGIKHTCYEGLATLNGRVTGPKWRIGFAARSDMPVFHLERKQSRLKPPGRAHAQYGHRRIVSIEPVGIAPTQCITVSAPSHVFLAGREMIPTCNSGKGPMSAAHICLEGVGPALFAGWAGKGDGYACRDHGCSCGWEYAYEPGEPMGMAWPTPLIQITALSAEQTDNIFGALRPMIEYGPLADVVPRTGEEFIRLPGGGRIDTVTSSAQSRLGQRITFTQQDEVGLWTPTNKMVRVADTQYRGLAGMGGRAALSTNAWDPAEHSVAQQQYESNAKDIYRQFLQPPANLSYRNKVERRKIHRIVYEDALRERGGHVDLDSIEAEAADLMERDPAQAARFFGNIIVAGQGSWLPDGLWAGTTARRLVAPGTMVCAGFDGSDVDDWTALRVETLDGYQFTPRYLDGRLTLWNPAAWGGRIPRGEVHAAMDYIFRTYKVLRLYADPRDWQTEIETWASQYGDEVVIPWATYRIVQMHAALERTVTDLTTGALTHDDCTDTALHVGNARKIAKPGDRYILGKPSQAQKIDSAVTSVLCHEATADANAAGLGKTSDRRVMILR